MRLGGKLHECLEFTGLVDRFFKKNRGGNIAHRFKGRLNFYSSLKDGAGNDKVNLAQR